MRSGFECPAVGVDQRLARQQITLIYGRMNVVQDNEILPGLILRRRAAEAVARDEARLRC